MTKARIEIGADDKTGAAFASVSRNLDKLKSNANEIQSTVSGMFAAFGVAVSVGAITSLITETAKAIDQFNDLADTTGASIENISALDRVARETGANFDTVAGSLIKFNKILNDTDDEGSKAAQILKSLGLNAQQLKSEDPAEAMRQLAVALSKFADDGNKGRAILELTGKSAREMAPFLKDLAEKTTLVGTTSTETAQKVEAFNKALYQIKAASEDAKRSLLTDLLPTLQAATDEFIVGREKSKGWLDAILTFGTINPFRSQASNIEVLREELQGLNADRDRYLKSKADTSGIDAAIAKTQRQLGYLKELQARSALFSMPSDTGDAMSRRLGFGRPSLNRTPEPPKAVKDPYADAQRYLEALTKQIEKTAELTNEEQALRDIQMGRLGKVREDQEMVILATSRYLDIIKAEKDNLKASEDAAKKAAESSKRLFDESEKLRRMVETPTERLTREMEELNRVLEDNPLVDQETAARRATQIWEEFKRTLEDVNKETSKMDDFAKQAAEGIQDAIGDGLQSIMEGNFENIGDAFTKMLNRMVAEAAAAQISRYLFGDMVKGGEGSGIFGSVVKQFVGSMFGTQGGGLTPGDFARMDRIDFPSYAVGTPYVPHDMLAKIHQGERIVPAAQNNGSWGASVSNNFYISGPVDRRTQDQIAAAAASGAQRALRRTA